MDIDVHENKIKLLLLSKSGMTILTPFSIQYMHGKIKFTD